MLNRRTTTSRAPRTLCLLALALAATAAHAQTAQTAQEKILAAYVAKAGAPASAERGQAFFTQKRPGNLFESCADCHTDKPTARGRDQGTEKVILPMAPAANPKRFTDASRVENLFQMNCKDVVGRVCTAQEKADMLAWLLSFKP